MQDKFTFEHIVKQKCEGHVIATKTALIIAYIAFLILILIVLINFCPVMFFPPLALLGLTVETVLIIFTWKYSSVEYEYEIVGNMISFYQIYGKRKRKHVLDVDIKSFTQFSEYDDDAEALLSSIEVDTTYVFVSSPSAPEVCYAMVDSENERYIIYFEVPDTAMNIIKRLNSSAIRNAKAALQNRKSDQNN